MLKQTKLYKTTMLKIGGHRKVCTTVEILFTNLKIMHKHLDFAFASVLYKRKRIYFYLPVYYIYIAQKRNIEEFMR